MRANHGDGAGPAQAEAWPKGSSLAERSPDEALDRLVRLAARALGVPIAALLLRDRDALYVRSGFGLAPPLATGQPVPLERMPCAGILGPPERLVIEDARRDGGMPCPISAAAAGVRGYAAVALKGAGDAVIGVLVAMDTRPRRWREDELRALDDLAASLVTELGWRIAAAETARAAELQYESEERFRLMVEGGEQVFFFTHDREGRFEYVSPSVEAVLGYAPEELIGRTYHVLLAGRESERLVDGMTSATLAGGGRPSTYDSLTRHRDGRRVVVEVVESARRDGPEIIGVQGFARDITARRRAEEELRVRTAHLEHLIENAPEPIVLLDPDERVLRVNREFIRVFGYTAAEAVGCHIADLIVREPERTDAARLAARVARGETVAVRAVRRRKDGSELHVSILATPVVLEGAPTAIFGIYRDITDRVRAEAAVRRSAEYFRALIERSSDVIYILEANGRVRYTAPSLRRVLGFDPAEMVGRNVLEFVHPDDRKGVVEAFAAVAQSLAEAHVIEVRVRHRDGSWRAFEAFARNLLDDPAVRGVVVTSRDVTARVESAAELQRNAVILASIPDAVVVTDPAGTVTYWNEGATRLFGWSGPEMLGASLVERLPAEMRERFATELERVVAGEAIHGDYEHVRRDGSRILADTRVSLIRDSGGKPSAVLRITRDITEQRLLGRVLEEIPEAVICLDAENRIVSSNAAAERIFGYAPAELAGQPIEILSPGSADRAGDVASIVGRTRRHGGWTGEVVRRRKDGSHFPALLTTGVVRDVEGRVVGQAGLVRDLTREKLREAQLRRAERMTSLGTLLGGLAHELNNPLTSIKSFAQLLLLDERSAEDRDGLEVIRAESDRAAKLVADLRLLARQTQAITTPAREAVDLNELVRAVLAERHASLRAERIELGEDLAAGPLPVWGVRAQLEQAVRQLVVNAEQALRAHEAARRLIVRSRAGTREVSLSVVDTGPGIEAAHLERIFDPFWTTRAPGEGAGLGLSMVQTVVTQHGGTIRVDSGRGAGTRFIVELPHPADARCADGEHRGATSVSPFRCAT